VGKLAARLVLVALVCAGGAAAAQPPGLTAPEPEPAVSERPRARWWKPLAVFGSGLGVVGVGAVFQWRATEDLDAFERAVQQQCAEDGCSPDEIAPLRDLERRAVIENRVAVGCFVVGGLAIVGGITWGILNRPQRMQVAPTAGADGAGVVLAGRF
jgi:hypothetical protein